MEEKNNFLPSCTQEVIQSYKVRSVSRFVDSSRPLARVISQSDSSSMSFSACRRADDDDALLRATVRSLLQIHTVHFDIMYL